MGTVARPRISYTTGVRNDHRNKSYWNVDVKLTKEMNLPHGMNLQVSMEIYNLLNDGTYQIYNPGLEAGQQVNGGVAAEGVDPVDNRGEVVDDGAAVMVDLDDQL